MRIAFSFSAEPREAQGKGASRRLRHLHKVPAILYGGHAQAEPLALEHHKLLTVIADERFYSSIVQLKIGERTQEAIVKDVQMHPAKNQIVHVDLQRVTENEPIRLHVPIHFAGEAGSPGVKTQGGVVSHMLTDVEIVCLPKDLPEYLELDLSQMNIIGDIDGKVCVLVDDMIDTAGTLCHAARALKDEGAQKVVAYITHPVLSGDAVSRIADSVLDELVVTDTIPLSQAARECARIRQLSVAGLLAETIRRIRDEESVSSLYVD